MLSGLCRQWLTGSANREAARLVVDHESRTNYEVRHVNRIAEIEGDETLELLSQSHCPILQTRLREGHRRVAARTQAHLRACNPVRALTQVKS